MRIFIKQVREFYSFKQFFSFKRNKNFTINILVINIFFITLLRGLFDELWLGELNYFENIYVWFVLLCIYVIAFPVTTDYIVCKIFRLRYSKKRLLQFFDFSSKLWWLVVFVSFISWVTGDGSGLVRIEFFKYVPTFMVEGNYLPIGMLVLIPVFIFLTAKFVSKVYKLSFYKSLIPSFLGLLIIYLLFYQWLWQLFHYFFRISSLNGNGFKSSYFIGCAPLLFLGLVYLLFTIPRAYSILNRYKLLSYYMFVIVNMLILLFYPNYGIIHFLIYYL